MSISTDTVKFMLTLEQLKKRSKNGIWDLGKFEEEYFDDYVFYDKDNGKEYIGCVYYPIVKRVDVTGNDVSVIETYDHELFQVVLDPTVGHLYIVVTVSDEENFEKNMKFHIVDGNFENWEE